MDMMMMMMMSQRKEKNFSRFWEKKANGKLSISLRNSKKKKKFLSILRQFISAQELEIMSINLKLK